MYYVHSYIYTDNTTSASFLFSHTNDDVASTASITAHNGYVRILLRSGKKRKMFVGTLDAGEKIWWNQNGKMTRVKPNKLKNQYDANNRGANNRATEGRYVELGP